MAWPPPTHGGAESLHQLIAQQAFLNNNGGASFANPGGHAPITNDEIESEYEFNAEFAEPHRVLAASVFDVEPGAGGSSSGYGAPRVHGQSPQTGASGGGGSGAGSSGGGAGPSSKTTLDAKRSLQARGKSYHTGSGELQGREWEDRQRRDEAVSILESEEMLMWIAGVRNESIPQTRAYYRNIVLGLEQPPVVWNDEWEVQGSGPAEGQGGSGSPARSGKGKERDIAKMRKRVSSGQGPA